MTPEQEYYGRIVFEKVYERENYDWACLSREGQERWIRAAYAVRNAPPMPDPVVALHAEMDRQRPPYSTQITRQIAEIAYKLGARATLVLLALWCFAVPARAQLPCSTELAYSHALSYVAAVYGGPIVDVYCSAWSPSLSVCYYPDGAFAAVVEFPKQVRSPSCQISFLWWNCPYDGGGCVHNARVICSGVLGKNWREACQQEVWP